MEIFAYIASSMLLVSSIVSSVGIMVLLRNDILDRRTREWLQKNPKHDWKPAAHPMDVDKIRNRKK